MKEINEMLFDEDALYTEDHEWVKQSGDTCKIGLSDYAQEQLGDIVFVELPEEGDTFEKGEELGTVESVKAVSEVYMPIGGEVIAVNSQLEDAPNLVNESPFTDGWMIEVKPSDPTELDALMSKDVYVEMLKGAE